MCRATFRGILGSGWSLFSMAEPRSEMAKAMFSGNAHGIQWFYMVLWKK